MKNKKLALFMALTLSVGAFGGALALQNAGSLFPKLGKAEINTEHSYTITASNFTSAKGDFEICGIKWHYEAASVTDGVVTISAPFSTKTASGSTKSGDVRGMGYSGIRINDLTKVGEVTCYTMGADREGMVGRTVASEMDFSTIEATNKRMIEFNMATDASFSFTSMTLYYDCGTPTPTIEITTTSCAGSVGDVLEVKAKKTEVYGDDDVSYTWSSDDTDVATVSGDGLTGSVTGVAAGTANITITMRVNGVNYTDSIKATFTAAPATVYYLSLEEGASLLGNQLFMNFSTGHLGKTAKEITDLGVNKATFTGINNTVDVADPRNINGNRFELYVTGANGAVGFNDTFKITVDFLDVTNNIIYRAQTHYSSGVVAPEILLTNVSGTTNVNIGENLEFTVDKASYITEAYLFNYSSSDDTILSVSSNGNSITASGVAAGTAYLLVNLTVGQDEYLVAREITVMDPAAPTLIPWYTEGKDNQRNWRQGGGLWTWVKYGELGYNGFAAFSAVKDQMTASYTTTTVRVEVISDDIASIKVARVYLVLGAAYDGTLSMTIPSEGGDTYTGSITFVDGEATKYNS